MPKYEAWAILTRIVMSTITTASLGSTLLRGLLSVLLPASIIGQRERSGLHNFRTDLGSSAANGSFARSLPFATPAAKVCYRTLGTRAIDPLQAESGFPNGQHPHPSRPQRKRGPVTAAPSSSSPFQKYSNPTSSAGAAVNGSHSRQRHRSVATAQPMGISPRPQSARTTHNMGQISSTPVRNARPETRPDLQAPGSGGHKTPPLHRAAAPRAGSAHRWDSGA